MHELYELKEKLMKELEEYGSKDEMTAGTLEVVDKLAHTIKNLCKIIEDAEYSENGGSSYDGGSSYRGSSYEGSMRGSSYDGGSSYRGGGSSYRGSSYEGGSSYARGRGRNARRDSRGRYSSGNDMMLEQLQGMMQEAPDDRTRQEIQKLVSKLEQM